MQVNVGLDRYEAAFIRKLQAKHRLESGGKSMTVQAILRTALRSAMELNGWPIGKPLDRTTKTDEHETPPLRKRRTDKTNKKDPLASLQRDVDHAAKAWRKSLEKEAATPKPGKKSSP